MAYLRRLIMLDKWTPDEMIAFVKAEWPTSKASKADVSTQRGDLREAGENPPATIRLRVS